MMQLDDRVSEARGGMICRRCQGLMVVEPRYAETESDGSGLSPHRRCLNCGNVEDAVIRLRGLQPPPDRAMTRCNLRT